MTTRKSISLLRRNLLHSLVVRRQLLIHEVSVWAGFACFGLETRGEGHHVNEVRKLQVLYETGKRLASYTTVSVLKRKSAA